MIRYHGKNETEEPAQQQQSHDEHHHHEHHNETKSGEDHSHHHHHLHKEHTEVANLTGAELDDHHKEFHVHDDHYEHSATTTSTQAPKIVAWFNATRRMPPKDGAAEALSNQIINALKNGVHVHNENGTTNLIVAIAGQGGVINLNAVDAGKNAASGDAAIKVAILTNSSPNQLGHHHHHKHDKDCDCEMCKKSKQAPAPAPAPAAEQKP